MRARSHGDGYRWVFSAPEAALFDAAGRQVIFATSEELGSLSAMLRDVPHTLHSVDGYLLQPVVR